jgi:Flp pilus assembly protein TadD
LGRHDEAIRAFRRVVAIKPDATLAWIHLGQIFEGMGRQSQMEDCYHQALANHPHTADDLVILARLCQNRGWLEAAVTNCAEAVKLNPMDPEFHIEMGRCFAASGRFAEAEQQFAEAVRLAPESAETHYAYGLDLGKADKLAEAEEQFREAKRIAPDMLAARVNLGIALMNQWRSAEALAEFEEVLQRSPTNAVALHNVQVLHARLASKPKPAK